MSLENTIALELDVNQISDELPYAAATKEQRCLNFVIDNILMKFTLAYLTGMIFAGLLGMAIPELAKLIFDEHSILSICVATYMVSRVNYAIYYSVAEKCFRGYTVGKWITGTRAIRNDGEELSLKNAIHRSFSRFLPFEFLSGFSDQPWHDSWTDTTVVQVR